MRRQHAAMVAIALSIGLAGCNQGQKPAAGPVSSMPVSSAPQVIQPIPAAVLTTSGGAYRLLVAPGPADIPKNQMFSFTVQVRDASGNQPVTGIELAVDAAMPAHHHGMNTKPKVIANPDRTFTVRGMMLHMSGDWEIYFDVTRGGATERAQMNVNLP